MSRMEQIQKMLAAEPEDVFLNFGLAMEYAKAGKIEEALAQFDRVVEIDPDYVPAHFQKGSTLAGVGRIDEARTVLQNGIQVALRTGNSHAAGEMNELLQTLG